MLTSGKKRRIDALLILCFGFILALAAGCQTTNQKPATENLIRERRAVLSASSEWDRLFNAADAVELAALYAEDAVSMPPNAPTLRGRNALQRDFQQFWAANLARHETVVEDLIIEGDLAIERARYRLTYQPRAGGPEIVETGRHLECRRRLGSQWKIAIEIWNSDAAPAK